MRGSICLVLTPVLFASASLTGALSFLLGVSGDKGQLWRGGREL